MENRSFFRGIVEGFYGRPWSEEQRKNLFHKMKDFGLASFMYAPKDDHKHRTCWRELYTPGECNELQQLIVEAEKHQIQFFYTLSPGLDMVYSSERDRHFLRSKFEQVARLGCRSFAILFDDIEPQLQPADRLVFQSFAEAHVAVANDIYEALVRPPFLFCPTEYCAARAVPNVTTSQYLHCVGRNLQPEIDILWTGPQVISRTITVESLQELEVVIRRKPIIWDNLHANDYGQRRLFLGPYTRDPAIILHIRGVFTNPNCQLEANFNAFYTLGLWIKCGLARLSGEICDEAVAAYEPRAALMGAIKHWLKEFQHGRHVPNDYPAVLPLSTGSPLAEGLGKLNGIGLVNTPPSPVFSDKLSLRKSDLYLDKIDVESMDLVLDTLAVRTESSGKIDPEKKLDKNAADEESGGDCDALMRSAGSDELSTGKDNVRDLGLFVDLK